MQFEPKKKTSCETQINISNTFEKLLHEKDIAMASLDFLNPDDDVHVIQIEAMFI